MEFPRMCPARWLSDQNLGMGMPPHDFLYQFYDMHPNYYRPWKYSDCISKEFGSTIENEKGNFKITLDVQYFRPNEINVKVANDEIIVEGKHEERPDTHGFVTRQFRRRYPLPSQYPAENVTSTLSSDGVLTIIAEKKLSKEVEKIVPIKMCGVCPRKNQIEAKMTSEITQQMQKENLKETEDVMSNNKSHVIFKEDHSLLLKPEMIKDTILETNGTCTKMEATKGSVEVVKTSGQTDPLNINSTTNKIEESIGKSILGLTALTEQLGQSSLTCTSDISGMKGASKMSDIKSTSVMSAMKNASEMSGMKSAAEMSGMKSAAEMSGMKSASEISGISASDMSSMKSTSETSGLKKSSEFSGTKSATEMSATKNSSEMSGTKRASETSSMKSALEIGDMKSALEACGMKSLDMCGMKGLSKMLVEESSSSYKSSSSMSSSTRISGNTGEAASDITAELREAAENI